MVLIEAQVLIETHFTDTTFCAPLRPDQNKVDNLEDEKMLGFTMIFWGARPNINPTYVETLTW